MPSVRALQTRIRPLISAGVEIAEQAVGLAAGLAREVTRRVPLVGGEQDQAESVAVRVAPEREPAPKAPAAASPAAAPPPPATEPPIPPEVKTVDDEHELVAEFGEAGAEDPAGAQVEIEEPFGGYARMAAADVIERLGAAPAELAAAVVLYESSHRNRPSVIHAAERHLAGLANSPVRARGR